MNNIEERLMHCFSLINTITEQAGERRTTLEAQFQRESEKQNCDELRSLKRILYVCQEIKGGYQAILGHLRDAESR